VKRESNESRKQTSSGDIETEKKKKKERKKIKSNDWQDRTMLVFL